MTQSNTNEFRIGLMQAPLKMGLRGLGYSALGSIEREIETPESRSKYLDRNERLWCCWTHESTMARWLREASVVIAKAIVLMLLSSAVCMAPAMAQSTPVISPTNGSFATRTDCYDHNFFGLMLLHLRWIGADNFVNSLYRVIFGK